MGVQTPGDQGSGYGLEIVEVRDPRVVDSILRLRFDVWSAQGAVFPVTAAGRWSDPYDASAVHWAVLDGGRVLAAARLTVHASVEDMIRLPNLPRTRHVDSYRLDLVPPVAGFSRLVVAPEQRGIGLARRMDELRFERANALHCRSAVAITSNPQRVSALLRAGFRIAASTEVFVGETRRPGQILVRRLP